MISTYQGCKHYVGSNIVPNPRGQTRKTESCPPRYDTEAAPRASDFRRVFFALQLQPSGELQRCAGAQGAFIKPNSMVGANAVRCA